MSISATMSSALSGLTASARGADVVASNIANALTEGYARRELQLTARSLGGTGQGVQVAGVVRATDMVLVGDRRLADAAAADRQTRADFLSTVEQALGSPEEERSITARIAAFDASLLAAASRPDSEARLNAVIESARSLTVAFTDASRAVQSARTVADEGIARDVRLVNDTLATIADTNAQILTLSAAGRDASTLMDQRQQLVDRIAGIIPLREVDRGMGVIALYTIGGAPLLDGIRPARLGFTPAGIVTPEMTQAAGGLSGLTLNGRPVALGEGGPLSGGSLSAQFAIRDGLGPEAQMRLDALARDLVERLADPAVDPTLTPGVPGLFTDGGAALDPMNETGLALRLRLNAQADPLQGGNLYRLRDGLGATTPGPAGQAALLTAMETALTRARQPVSGGFMLGERSLSVLAGQVVSILSEARLSAESEASFGAARAEALKAMELQGGVDTDQELQRLLAVEQAYGANARVITAVDDMLQMILGI